MQKKKTNSKNGKPIKKNRPSIFRKFFNFIKAILILIKKTVFFFIRLFKKKPKSSLIFITSFCLALVVWNTLKNLSYYAENVLPEQIEVNVGEQHLASAIHTDLNNLLLWAKKHHENRSLFLKQANRILSSYDKIDQYWVRLGFDHTLHVNASLQIPVFLLQGKSGDLYVISSNSQIIAKNPSPKQYIGLYRLNVPELKISWRSKAAALSTHAIAHTTVTDDSTNTINFALLIKQTQALYSQIQEQQIPYFVTKVTWTKANGFEAILMDKQTSRTIAVQLGKENYPARIAHLKGMLLNLAQKNIFPIEIDLNYKDKASFKTAA